MRVYTSAGSLEAANHCWIQHSWEDAVYASSIPVSKRLFLKIIFMLIIMILWAVGDKISSSVLQQNSYGFIV